MITVAIVTGSTRPGRHSLGVARWIADVASTRDDANFEIVDIAENGLPLLEEPVPGALSGANTFTPTPGRGRRRSPRSTASSSPPRSTTAASAEC